MNSRLHWQELRQGGFTLLELSVVLTIIALVTGSGIILGIAQLQKSQHEVTYKRLEAINETLVAFRKAYDRLPCPANPSAASSAPGYATEVDESGIGSGECEGIPVSASNTDVAHGAVPVRALGLPDSYLYDGWGNKFKFAIYRFLTASNTFSTGGADSGLYLSGRSATATAPGYKFREDILYFIISHGPNGHGAYGRSGNIKNAGSTNMYEQENCICDSSAADAANNSGAFYIGEFDENTAGGTFDDIAIYGIRDHFLSPSE